MKEEIEGRRQGYFGTVGEVSPLALRRAALSMEGKLNGLPCGQSGGLEQALRATVGSCRPRSLGRFHACMRRLRTSFWAG